MRGFCKMLFDNEKQDYLYSLGQKLLKQLVQQYPKYSREKNRKLEEILDKINARHIKPRLSQDELDEVLRALGVPVKNAQTRQEPGKDYVKIVDIAKVYKYHPVGLLKALGERGIQKIKYKKQAYAKREDVEMYLFGKTNVNIEEYIAAVEFVKKYKVKKSDFYNCVRKVDFGDNILHGNRCYIRKTAVEMVLSEIKRRAENDKIMRNKTEIMRQEGYICTQHLAQIFAAKPYLVTTLMCKWNIPIKRVFTRYVFYNIDALIDRIREGGKKGKEPGIGQRIVERQEEYIDKLKKFKEGKGIK
jgi:hypothetical protein